jgi:integral membrane protein
MSYVTGSVLAAGTIALILKHVFDVVLPGYAWLWVGHGYLFMVYLVTVVDLGVRARFPVLKLLGVAVAGTIPFAAFFVEPRVERGVRAQLAAAVTTAQPDSNTSRNDG